MGSDEVLKVLRDDLEKGRKQSRLASDCFDAVIKDSPSGLPCPDDTERIRNAWAEYSESLKLMMSAMTRLNAFVVHGTVPHDLKH
jgi:hypothetical protein